MSGGRRTTSGIEIRPLYGPADAEGDPARIGEPGAFPFTRGLRADGYRTRPWTIRQYAGFGTPDEANERFRFLLAQGQPGLSVAFDLPTQMGMDSDDARALGEVGRVGVAIDTLADVVALFDGIPLDAVSTSMTINAPAPVLVAMYVVAAELQGVPAALGARARPRTTCSRSTSRAAPTSIRPRPSLRLAADLVAWCASEAPRFNAISLSGYHMREAGSTAVQEMAFGLANAIAYVEAVLAHGVAVDDFAPRLSWIFNTHTNFFEEIAKYRALRRMWATRDARSLRRPGRATRCSCARTRRPAGRRSRCSSPRTTSCARRCRRSPPCSAACSRSRSPATTRPSRSRPSTRRRSRCAPSRSWPRRSA